MGTALELIIVVTIGSVLVVNGVAVKADDILASARQSASMANVHQLSTALELYYLDHDAYPDADSGKEMIDILAQDNYIQSRPADPSVYVYRTEGGGQSYDLSLK